MRINGGDMNVSDTIKILTNLNGTQDGINEGKVKITKGTYWCKTAFQGTCFFYFLMDKGKIVFDGTPGELFSHRDDVYEAGLETPQVSQLFYLLNKEAEFNLPEDTIDVDTACERLKALLKGGSHVS